MKRYIKSSEDAFVSEFYDIVKNTVKQFMSQTDKNADYDLDTSITEDGGIEWFNIYIATSLSYKENENLMYTLNNAISAYSDTGFDLTDAGLDISIAI